MAGPRLTVDPPAFTPQPYGLMSVVSTVSANTPHWQNGITWQSRCMSPMGNATYDECIAVTGIGDPPPEPSAKTENVELIDRGATPFTVYAKFECSTTSVADANKIATDALARSETWQVERIFWTGIVDGKVIAFPHLAATTPLDDAQGIMIQSAAITVTGSPVDIATGLGLLEAELADCYNGVGVIHVPIELLPTLDAHGLVKATNGILKTLNGNLVAVGAGYTGSSPAGVAPATGTTWMYATGALMMYRGDVRIAPLNDSINRANNTVKMIAERTYVLGWDCCHAAVLIDIGVS